MKRKKPPVVLASILVVMAGAAILFIPKNEDPMMQPPPQQQPTDAQPTGMSRQTPAKSAIVRRASMADAPSPDAEPGIGAGGANPLTATIYVPRAQPMKQQPNDATVQTQWYREGARAGRKEGFR